MPLPLSVIIPTHDPDPGRLRRVLIALRGQSLPPAAWEPLVVDNASSRPPGSGIPADAFPANVRIIGQPRLGLSHARRAGLEAARGAIAVFVDDDNVLAPDYLARVWSIFESAPRLGAIGGRVRPEFEKSPAAWVSEFYPLLALRDLGPEPIVAPSLRAPGSNRDEYPPCAPIGAGMALRREAWTSWLGTRAAAGHLTDRCGDALTSGGDNDIVLCALRAGWGVGYFPELHLTHLVPPFRLEPGYLARLNRGIQDSWMRVLALHGVNPWPQLTRRSARLRKAKAWLVHQPWRSPAARIRWAGACGHFDGRVAG